MVVKIKSYQNHNNFIEVQKLLKGYESVFIFRVHQNIVLVGDKLI